MAILPNDLIAQFVKVTNDKTKAKKETTVYGVAVEKEGKMYVRLDGSDILTPVATTVEVLNGERVVVQLKNHTATITGNISSPSARMETVRLIVENVDGIQQEVIDLVHRDDFEGMVEEYNQRFTELDERVTANKTAIDNVVNVSLPELTSLIDGLIAKIEALENA